MPSFEIHHLGVELEMANSYLRPEFPPEGSNSADFYDYGNGLLFGVTLGVNRLRSLVKDIAGVRSPGSALTNVETALESAYQALTQLQNDPSFDIHKTPRPMAPMVRMLHALAAFHAHAMGKTRMWE